MRIKNFRRGLAAAAGLGVTLAGGAVPAHASASSVPVRAGMVIVEPGTVGSAVAPCPDGAAPTGGGFLNIDALDKASDVEIAMSHPDVNGWGISAFNATTAPHPVFVYAICAPTPRQPTRAAMVNVESGEQGTVGVACEAGTSVTGGGFLNIDGLKGASDVEIAASRPDGNGWQVTAFNGTAAPHPVFVFATCVAD